MWILPSWSQPLLSKQANGSIKNRWSCEISNSVNRIYSFWWHKLNAPLFSETHCLIRKQAKISLIIYHNALQKYQRVCMHVLLSFQTNKNQSLRKCTHIHQKQSDLYCVFTIKRWTVKKNWPGRTHAPYNPLHKIWQNHFLYNVTF